MDQRGRAKNGHIGALTHKDCGGGRPKVSVQLYCSPRVLPGFTTSNRRTLTIWAANNCGAAIFSMVEAHGVPSSSPLLKVELWVEGGCYLHIALMIGSQG